MPNFGVTVTIDPQTDVGKEKVKRDLVELEGQGAKTTKAIGSMGSAGQQAGGQLQRGVKGARDELEKVDRAVVGMTERQKNLNRLQGDFAKAITGAGLAMQTFGMISGGVMSRFNAQVEKGFTQMGRLLDLVDQGARTGEYAVKLSGVTLEMVTLEERERRQKERTGFLRERMARGESKEGFSGGGAQAVTQADIDASIRETERLHGEVQAIYGHIRALKTAEAVEKASRNYHPPEPKSGMANPLFGGLLSPDAPGGAMRGAAAAANAEAREWAAAEERLQDAIDAVRKRMEAEREMFRSFTDTLGRGVTRAGDVASGIGGLLDGMFGANEAGAARFAAEDRERRERTQAGAGGMAGLRDIKTELTDIGALTRSSLVEGFHEAEAAIIRMARTGKLELGSLADSFLAMALQIGIRGGMKELFGFQTGGSFMVGGGGGVDRTPVAFMATRGERVTVDTPGRARGGGDGKPQVNVISGIDHGNMAEAMLATLRSGAGATVINELIDIDRLLRELSSRGW